MSFLNKNPKTLTPIDLFSDAYSIDLKIEIFLTI